MPILTHTGAGRLVLSALGACLVMAALAAPARAQSPAQAQPQRVPAGDPDAPKVGPDGAWPALMASTPIFDEIVVQQLPPGFKPQTEKVEAGGRVYLRSMVAASDPIDGPWTQRFLVTGAKDEALKPDAAAKTYALHIASSFKEACPTTFMGAQMLQGRIDTGHDAFVLVVACGRHTHTNDKQPVSEITVIATYKGDRNMYTMQRSLRAAPMDVAPKPERAMLQQWLTEMTPVRICAKQPGEPAPYASCLKK